MSLETWKEEFYPVAAKDVPLQTAIDHSIRKWEGLTPENLQRHGIWKLSYRRIGIDDDDPLGGFFINSGTCALCHYFILKTSSCANCPLFEVRGLTSCDSTTDLECSSRFLSPYEEFLELGNTASMLAWLRMAKQWEEENK